MLRRNTRFAFSPIRTLFVLVLAMAASSAFATPDICGDPTGRDEDPSGGVDCRTETSGVVGSGTNPSNVITNPPPLDLSVIDVCPIWAGFSGVPVDSMLTFAEIEIGSSDGFYTGVLVLSYARVRGTDQLLVDWVPGVAVGWSLSNPANSLPSWPAAAIAHPGCNLQGDWPTAKLPLVVDISGSSVKVLRDGGVVFERSVVGRVLQPRTVRVKNFRANASNGVTVFGRWRSGVRR